MAQVALFHSVYGRRPAVLAAGHLFTDPGTPGHDEQAAALAWQRSLRFLGSL